MSYQRLKPSQPTEGGDHQLILLICQKHIILVRLFEVQHLLSIAFFTTDFSQYGLALVGLEHFEQGTGIRRSSRHIPDRPGHLQRVGDNILIKQRLSRITHVPRHLPHQRRYSPCRK